MSIIFKGTTGTTIIKRTGGSTFVTKAQASPAILAEISPEDLSNLILWTPAISASSNQGTFVGATDGNDVCAVFAQASSSEDGWNRIHRANSTDCPEFVVSSSDFNNLPAVLFDSASNEHLDAKVDVFPSEFNVLHNSSSWVIMLVLMISGTNPEPIQTIFDNLDDNSNIRRGINLRYRDDASNNDRLIFNLKNGNSAVVTGSTENGGFTAGSPHILTITHISGSELKIFVDGVQNGGDGDFSSGQNYSQLNTADQLQFGLNTIGAPIGRPAKMFMTDFVIYKGSKSEGDRQGVEKFFSNKYNISVPF